MIECHLCHKSNQTDARFCTYCGVRLNVDELFRVQQPSNYQQTYIPPHHNDGWYPRSNTPLNAGVKPDNTDQRDWWLGGIFDWLF